MKKTASILLLITAAALVALCAASCTQGVVPPDTEANTTQNLPSTDPDESTVDVTTVPDATTVPDVTSVSDVSSESETTTEPEATTDAETSSITEITTEPAHVHTFASEWSISETQHWHECSCGEKADSAAHSFGNWEILTEASETVQGLKKHVCTVCGYEETQTIPTLDHVHSFSAGWSKNDVNHWHVCSCGEKADVSGHTFGDWRTTKASTCSAAGEKERSCSVCGYVEKAAIEKLAHTPAADAAVAPTCTNSGKTEGSHCSVCGTVLTAQQTVPAAGHSFGEWTVNREATCLAKGQKSRACTVCGVSETQDIAALGHDYVENVVPPTVTGEGYTEHVCSRCSDTYRDNIVEATGSLGFAYTNNGDGTCTITGIGTCTDTEIYIPKKIDGLTVVGFGDSAFDGQTRITSIVFNETISAIGEKAFRGTSISEITIPESVMTIGAQIFDSCSNLSTVYYNSGFSPARDAGFLNTNSIKKVVFNGENVPGNICYSCGALTDVEFGPNVKKILGYAFHSCSSLVNVSFNTVSLDFSSGRHQFTDCTSLETLRLPEGLTTLGSYTFMGCTNLKNVTLPSTLKSVGDRPFWDCSSIDNLYISDLKAYCSIGYESETYGGSTLEAKHIYLNGQLLTKAVIPDTVTRIPCNAFNSDDIKEAVIPASVMLVGATAFRWDELNKIHYEGPERFWEVLYKSAGSPATSATITFGSGTGTSVVQPVFNENEFGTPEEQDKENYLGVLPAVLPDGTALGEFKRPYCLDDYIAEDGMQMHYYQLGNSAEHTSLVDTNGGAVYGTGLKMASYGKTPGDTRGEFEVHSRYEANVKGAKGILFYVDLSHVQSNGNLSASVTLNTNSVRTSKDKGGSVGYYYLDGNWVETHNITICRLALPDGFAGWVYVPATSFIFYEDKKEAYDSTGRFKDIPVENMRCYTDGYYYATDDSSYIIFDEIVYVY